MSAGSFRLRYSLFLSVTRKITTETPVVFLIQSDSAVRRDFTVHFWGPESVQLSNNEMLDWEKYFSTDRYYPDIPT